jgi:hypothetical protein
VKQIITIQKLNYFYLGLCKGQQPLFLQDDITLRVINCCNFGSTELPNPGAQVDSFFVVALLALYFGLPPF